MGSQKLRPFLFWGDTMNSPPAYSNAYAEAAKQAKVKRQASLDVGPVDVAKGCEDTFGFYQSLMLARSESPRPGENVQHVRWWWDSVIGLR
jgi:hypothetical protein